MNTGVVMKWKQKLDGAKDLSEVQSLMAEAIKEGSRDDLLALLGELYDEFRGEDCAGGGASGTLNLMKHFYEFLNPTVSQLDTVGVDAKTLQEYLNHDHHSVATCA